MRSAILLLFLAISVIPYTSTAQTIDTEISALSKGAEIILAGKVVNQKAQWTSDKSAVFTRVTVQVQEFLKGNTFQQTITLIHPGGEVDGVGELYTHIPTFSNDENVLLFARKHRNNNDYEVFQGEAGKFTLYTDDHGELRTDQRKSYSALKEEIRKSLSEK